MRALGAAAAADHTVYLVGGATAVIHGWRPPTVDIDLALDDVEQMIASGLVEPLRLQEMFDEIAGDLYRFPAIDPEGFRRRVRSATAARGA